ncbi:MAG: hypothetical protein GY847_01290 [Proteobacteria bacterium]|nr:hypothetical protein [Pseudomonadota bacterium]
MHKNKENSVIKALMDLTLLEDERAEEEQKKIQHRQEESMRLREEERRRQEQKRADREAEVARQRRIEEEVQRRDKEAGRRIAALRAELTAVQAEREVMRQGLYEHSQDLTPVRSKNQLPLAFGLPAAVLVGVCLSLLLTRTVFQETPQKLPEQAGPKSDLEGIPFKPEKTVFETTISNTQASSASPLIIDAHAEEVTKVAKPKSIPIGIRKPIKLKPPKVNKQGSKQKPTENNILESFEKCGDDPMCEKLRDKE